VKDQPLRTIDDVIAEIAGMSIEELANEPTEDDQHLITVDELRAAGALDVPSVWRKSLDKEPDLFSELSEADELGPEKKEPARIDPEDDGSGEEKGDTHHF
jgi:hypothetical protein